MPRILQNLRKHGIGMLNAGMMMNAVAMNTGCCSHAIRYLKQCFQATGQTKDQLHSGRSQDCYVLNTRLCNRFQTATASAANTHGIHDNGISAKTVPNCLHEGG